MKTIAINLSRIGLILFLATALSACATVKMGHDFDLHAFKSQVQRGETTRAQVHEWLGPPNSSGIVVDTGGSEFDEWTYFFGTGKLGKMEQAKLKILQIKFDQQGRVQGYNFSQDE